MGGGSIDSLPFKTEEMLVFLIVENTVFSQILKG